MPESTQFSHRRALALLLGLVTLAGRTEPARSADDPIVPPREGKSEKIVLFDGKTLDGWIGHDKH